MNFYEHTLIARQDISPSQIKQLQEKYTKIIENNDGNIVKFESWGLMHLSYLIIKIFDCQSKEVRPRDRLFQKARRKHKKIN